MRRLFMLTVIMLTLGTVRAASLDAIEILMPNGNSATLSATGQLFRLNLAAGAVVYDQLNRAAQVADCAVIYDELSRVAQVGAVVIGYDELSRVVSIGAIPVAYDTSNRVIRIGEATISYDEFSRAVRIAGKLPPQLRFAVVPGRT